MIEYDTRNGIDAYGRKNNLQIIIRLIDHVDIINSFPAWCRRALDDGRATIGRDDAKGWRDTGGDGGVGVR